MAEKPAFRYVPSICRDYNHNVCNRPDCTRPHLCYKYFHPKEFCKNGKDCEFSHNIFSPHAKTCLRKAGFDLSVKAGDLRAAYVEALKRKEESMSPKKGQPPPHRPEQVQQVPNWKGRKHLAQPADQMPQPLLPMPFAYGNIPRICANFNQGLCHLPVGNCNLLHICQAYVELTCPNDFKNCPFSHDIYRPDVKQKLAANGFNVQQKPKHLLDDYRQALRSLAVGASQPLPLAPPHFPAGKPPRGIGYQMKSQSAMDIRGAGQGAKPKGKTRKQRRPMSQERRSSVSLNASKHDEVKAKSDNSESSEYDACLEAEGDKTVTKKKSRKGRHRRGGKKKGKQKEIQESEAPSKVSDDDSEQEINEEPSYKYIPSVCKYYNKSFCKRPDCTCPHLCMEFFSPGKTCSNGDACKFSHSITDNPHAKQCLETAGFVVNGKSPADLRAEYLEALKFKEIAKETIPVENTSKISQKPSTAVGHKPHISLLDEADICIDYLSGKCAFGGACKNHHQLLPYLWQYKTIKNWASFSNDNTQLLEQSYCQVNTGNCSVIVEGQMFTVDFETFTASTSEMRIPVRRLSSASYVNEAKGESFVTQWKWFWESDEGWVPCGQKNVRTDKKNATRIQTELEEGYQKGSGSEMKLKINGYPYIVYFSNMRQKNCESGTERRLRRRPAYMSPDEVKNAARLQEMDKQKVREESRSLALPDDWSPMGNQDLCTEKVATISSKFATIKDIFQLSMPSASIILIKRIQNPTLWFTFKMKSDKLAKEYGPGNTKERRLFHGTCPEAVAPICEQNFDWRLYGSAVGARYGKGAYFAVQANKADQYVKPDENGICFMFYARVLVGKYTKGDKTMRRPPPLDSVNPSKLYDSCTDDPNSPSMFVIFDKDQYYPEYIILYKK